MKKTFITMMFAASVAFAQEEGKEVVKPTTPAPAETAAPAEEGGEETGAIVDPGDNVSSENELVHVVEKRRFRTNDRFEVFGYLPLQINGKFTEHQGLGGQVGYHFSDGFGLYLGANWFGTFGVFDGGRQSEFTTELVNRGRQQPLTASALVVLWNTAAGVEISPMYGKFSFFDNRVIHFTLFATGGAGLAQTHVQLRPPSGGGLIPKNPRVFGDTGVRPVGSLGGGFRVFLSDAVTLRLEIRDLLYSAEVDTINGCTKADLDKLTSTPIVRTGLTGACNSASFGAEFKDAVPAKDLVKETTSDVVNQVSFFGGVSILF